MLLLIMQAYLNSLREKAQQSFIDGSVKVVVATNAFGLGIDKNDIRFVHHFGLPKFRKLCARNWTCR